jgi:hypothetical protein
MTKIKIAGKDVELRVCPECKREVLSLITDVKTGRRFCHECHADPNSPEATVTRKITEHAAAGTLNRYPETTASTGDIIVEALIKMGRPLTVKNYIQLNTFGDASCLDELEGEDRVEVEDLIEEGLLVDTDNDFVA